MNGKQKLISAMSNFSKAHSELLTAIDGYEQASGTSVNDLRSFVNKYPFDKSFDELAVARWTSAVIAELNKKTFTVLNYEYLNTGGNTMVGIHEVWLPLEKKTVYAYTNEEGCTLSLVDYIRNELDVDDYDEFIIDYCDWGRLTGHETYFELYRRCLNDYTKDDCKYFGITRGISYHLLSDELQREVDPSYLQWIETENGGLVETDGKSVKVDTSYAPADDLLASIIKFKQWHDTIAGVEEYYDHHYTLCIAGHVVSLPFFADVWNAVDDMLQSTIEDW